MANFLWETQQQALQKRELNNFINSNPDSRELKRALAVKMVLIENKSVKEVQQLLNVSKSAVSRWKLAYQGQGLDGLRLKYKGSEGRLKAEKKGNN
jgi:putative transposase